MATRRSGLVVGLACLVLGACGPEGAGPSGGPGGGRTVAEGWRQLPSPPLDPRTSAVVAAVGGRMVVVGGWTFSCPPGADCEMPDSPLLRDGAVYDAATGSWAPIARAPFGLRRSDRSVVDLDDSAYLLTGCRSGPSCEGPVRLLEYDVGRDRWVDHGTPPGPAPAYASLVRVGETLVVLSGSDESGETPDFAFDTGDRTWRELPDDPLPSVYDRSAVAVGDLLVVAGSTHADVGTGGSTKVAARLDLDTLGWTRLPDAPGQGYQLFATDRGPLLNGHFVRAPGWLLDPATWTWAPLPAQSVEQDDLRGVLGRDGATYEIPNSVGELATSSRLFVYDSVAGDFARVPPVPALEDVHDDSSGALGRDLFVFGGHRWSGDGSAGEGRLLAEAWLWSPDATPR